MILVFEQDIQDHGDGRFLWRPSWFVGDWQGGRNWRLAWGLWSLSYFPSPGLRRFMDHIAAGKAEWRGSQSQPDGSNGR